ncbi:hypothetical protein Shyhy01_68940 [Streptomyces hygroscopicus subsp. hygroscopicus]|nr:hypothetical protein Shyhy01_68940 [Streptomyces hygroscopicus subsp. hygroscopicus]
MVGECTTGRGAGGPRFLPHVYGGRTAPGVAHAGARGGGVAAAAVWVARHRVVVWPVPVAVLAAAEVDGAGGALPRSGHIAVGQDRVRRARAAVRAARAPATVSSRSGRRTPSTPRA